MTEPSPYAPVFFLLLRQDIAHFARRDGETVTWRFLIRLFLLTQGFQFVLARRIQEALPRIPVIGRPARRIWWWWTCRRFGAELAIDATFGGGLYIPHPYGIVVGACSVGRDVAILQNVTIGTRGDDDICRAVIGDGTYLAAGAVILGPVQIGAGAKIGANAVVLRDVAAGDAAVGVPARTVRSAHTPDIHLK
ncbi:MULTISPECIES: serine O-acetyltransferase [unclassified Sphingomonas]|uniref:serine O-acetyltransferase n=1 Tax=unclassified Sphingomonas TaxID=196159 RepID=UPI0006F6BDC3|nr:MULTISPECIES: serine acetyltransferase [unclassified Sphingomonas]KQM58879.1 hypothetical protein ASE65_11030 [Sphingomonas sp. Leaf16]KQN11134.1 hypothetical protein ASE81_12020 [Sphingomonas sp. Leaf29]KQN18433.1 hypothetical protein ASE83_11945 [Sphingomonas sp. Leaf32]